MFKSLQRIIMAKETKSNYMNFRITPSLKDKFTERAAELGKAPGPYLIELIEKDLKGDMKDSDKPMLTNFAQIVSDKISEGIAKEFADMQNKFEQANAFSDSLTCYQYQTILKLYYFFMFRFETFHKTSPENMVNTDREAYKKATEDLGPILKLFDMKNSQIVMKILKGIK